MEPQRQNFSNSSVSPPTSSSSSSAHLINTDHGQLLISSSQPHPNPNPDTHPHPQPQPLPHHHQHNESQLGSSGAYPALPRPTAAVSVVAPSTSSVSSNSAGTASSSSCVSSLLLNADPGSQLTRTSSSSRQHESQISGNGYSGLFPGPPIPSSGVPHFFCTGPELGNDPAQLHNPAACNNPYGSASVNNSGGNNNNSSCPEPSQLMPIKLSPSSQNGGDLRIDPFATWGEDVTMPRPLSNCSWGGGVGGCGGGSAGGDGVVEGSRPLSSSSWGGADVSRPLSNSSRGAGGSGSDGSGQMSNSSSAGPNGNTIPGLISATELGNYGSSNFYPGFSTEGSLYQHQQQQQRRPGDEASFHPGYPSYPEHHNLTGRNSDGSSCFYDQQKQSYQQFHGSSFLPNGNVSQQHAHAQGLLMMDSNPNPPPHGGSHMSPPVSSLPGFPTSPVSEQYGQYDPMMPHVPQPLPYAVPEHNHHQHSYHHHQQQQQQQQQQHYNHQQQQLVPYNALYYHHHHQQQQQHHHLQQQQQQQQQQHSSAGLRISLPEFDWRYVEHCGKIYPGDRRSPATLGQNGALSVLTNFDGYPVGAECGYRPGPCIELVNYALWRVFYPHCCEMIITKTGRRMFPFIKVRITGLDPKRRYSVCADMVLADRSHLKYNNGRWQPSGQADNVTRDGRVFVHQDSPNTGAFWMKGEICFAKLKLTNNRSNVAGQVNILSMHKYQPRVHVMEVTEDGVGGGAEGGMRDIVVSAVYPETQFVAVTAYQNTDVTTLKIENNPFAKGFRESNGSALFDTTLREQNPNVVVAAQMPQYCLPSPFANAIASSSSNNNQQSNNPSGDLRHKSPTTTTSSRSPPSVASLHSSSSINKPNNNSNDTRTRNGATLPSTTPTTTAAPSLLLLPQSQPESGASSCFLSSNPSGASSPLSSSLSSAIPGSAVTTTSVQPDAAGQLTTGDYQALGPSAAKKVTRRRRSREDRMKLYTAGVPPPPGAPLYSSPPPASSSSSSSPSCRMFSLSAGDGLSSRAPLVASTCTYNDDGGRGGGTTPLVAPSGGQHHHHHHHHHHGQQQRFSSRQDFNCLKPGVGSFLDSSSSSSRVVVPGTGNQLDYASDLHHNNHHHHHHHHDQATTPGGATTTTAATATPYFATLQPANGQLSGLRDSHQHTGVRDFAVGQALLQSLDDHPGGQRTSLSSCSFSSSSSAPLLSATHLPRYHQGGSYPGQCGGPPSSSSPPFSSTSSSTTYQGGDVSLLTPAAAPLLLASRQHTTEMMVTGGVGGGDRGQNHGLQSRVMSSQEIACSIIINSSNTNNTNVSPPQRAQRSPHERQLQQQGVSRGDVFAKSQ